MNQLRSFSSLGLVVLVCLGCSDRSGSVEEPLGRSEHAVEAASEGAIYEYAFVPPPALVTALQVLELR